MGCAIMIGFTEYSPAQLTDHEPAGSFRWKLESRTASWIPASVGMTNRVWTLISVLLYQESIRPLMKPGEWLAGVDAPRGRIHRVVGELGGAGAGQSRITQDESALPCFPVFHPPLPNRRKP
jgi:hypothetical protein